MLRRVGGLSLAELIVAMGLLGILVVFVGALFISLLSGSTKESLQTVGLLFAQRRLDAAQGNGPPYWGGSTPLSADASGNYRETTSGEEGVYFQDDQSKTSFYYRFEALRVQTRPMGDLYRLSVDVVWWPSDATVAAQARPGQVRLGTGKQSVSLSRSYYHPNIKPL